MSKSDNTQKFLNIRKWDSEFININHLSFPQVDQVTHRIAKNLSYYCANYLIFFTVIFIIMSLTSLTMAISTLATLYFWKMYYEFYISKGESSQKKLLEKSIPFLALANLTLFVFLCGSTFFISIGWPFSMIIIHAFTIAEKGTEYELAKDRDSEETQGMMEGSELNIGRATYETGSIDMEEMPIGGDSFKSYGVLGDEDEEDNLEI